MKQAFTNKMGLSKANLQRLNTINKIIEEYLIQGFVLALRQLYYQLVSRLIIRNDQKEYRKLSGLLTKGRMAGIVDWDAIEDRGRKPHIPFFVDGVKDALQLIAEQYRVNRQEGQENYIELWTEKDALTNVFARPARPYVLTLMVNKGYSSSSAMYEGAKRFKQAYERGQKGVLLYFGDHDASGKHMVKDIESRLKEMRVTGTTIYNPALTMEQVRAYNLPENPAKETDPRAKWYKSVYGNKSWELDALPPPVLMKIVQDHVSKFIDMDLFNEMRRKEVIQKSIITQYASDYVENEDDYDMDIELDNSEFDFN